MENSFSVKNEDKKGTAVRFAPKKFFSIIRRSGRKIYIEPKALTYLERLNGYDQQQIFAGINELASMAHPLSGMQNTHRPMFFRAKKAPGLAGNFIIKYSINSDYTIVTAIILNGNLLGVKKNSADERASLYNVERINKINFDKGISESDVRKLTLAWKMKRPVTEVKTHHAAVNGMLNDLEKAAWLMGVHADVAYKKDSFNEFTLFHNPSEGGRADFYESVKDNLGFTTENAKHLSAVLRDVQLKKQPVKWVVHSQGGIIFKQAVKHHIKNHGGSSLNMNTVSFHAGGNNRKETDTLLSKVGIKKENNDRNNPFDLVPNLAGRNDLSLAAIKRSRQFWKKVKGEEGDSLVESPHTLPFLSLEAYHLFLIQAGNTRHASLVEKYMNSLK